MLYDMKLQPKPFAAVAAGRKTVEMRLYDDKRRQVKKGDEIRFTEEGTGSVLRTRVIALHRFDSFAELYRALPLEACGYAPGEKADPADMRAYYPPEKEKQYGVVGIELELIEK